MKIYGCLETCYWNLIEEKFCFDKNIALYEEPVKKSNEKNNNMFDNMAFYDSVSVIAGRAIVTIDPLPERKKETEPVVDQPRKKLKWPEKNSRGLEPNYLKKVPFIYKEKLPEKESTDTDGAESETHTKLIQKKLLHKAQIKKSVSFHNIPDKTSSSSSDEEYRAKSENLIVPEEEEVKLRKKSLTERRMSKSLSLKIGDFPKELPIIRQSSVPKFYLDTPEENQFKSSAIVPNSAMILKSPMAASSEFNFDLYSVVQIEKDRQTTQVTKNPPVPIHRESSKLNLIKDKIMLKKSKSTVSASNLPYSNHI